MKLFKKFHALRSTKQTYDSQLCVFNIVPENAIEKVGNDTIHLNAYFYGDPDKTSHRFNIEKLYYTDKIISILLTGLGQMRPVRIECLKCSSSKPPKTSTLSKMQTWKIVKMQIGTDNKWIEITNQSKLIN